MTDAPRACFEKKRYATVEIAHAVAADCYAKRRVWLRPYACDVCGGWHVTKTRALPPANANWSPPRKSQRQIAHERQQRTRRRRGRG